jgi:hypothetical protein
MQLFGFGLTLAIHKAAPGTPDDGHVQKHVRMRRSSANAPVASWYSRCAPKGRAAYVPEKHDFHLKLAAVIFHLAME